MFYWIGIWNQHGGSLNHEFLLTCGLDGYFHCLLHHSQLQPPRSPWHTLHFQLHRPHEGLSGQLSNILKESKITEKSLIALVFSVFKNKNANQSQKISNVFSPHKSFPGRQLNAASCKSLEIQASSIAKWRTRLSTWKFVWIMMFSCAYTLWK